MSERVERFAAKILNSLIKKVHLALILREVILI